MDGGPQRGGAPNSNRGGYPLPLPGPAIGRVADRAGRACNRFHVVLRCDWFTDAL